MKIKRLIDFLKISDFSGVAFCYSNDDLSEPLWYGYVSDIPWWCADMELDIIKNAGCLDEEDKAICFGRTAELIEPDIESKYRGKPVVEFYLKEN